MYDLISRSIAPDHFSCQTPIHQTPPTSTPHARYIKSRAREQVKVKLTCVKKGIPTKKVVKATTVRWRRVESRSPFFLSAQSPTLIVLNLMILLDLLMTSVQHPQIYIIIEMIHIEVILLVKYYVIMM